MILIGDNIMATLKASTFTLGTVTVRESYTGETPHCPMIVIDEIPTNGPAEGYAGNQPRIVRNVITVESYAKDMIIGGKVTTKKSAAMRLLIEADELTRLFNLIFGGHNGKKIVSRRQAATKTAK